MLAAGGSGALAGVLFAETKLARRRIPQATTDPPVSHDTTWAAAGVSRTRTPIRLAWMGDSTAAGYGVVHDRETPAAQLAIGISEAARRPVHVTNVAVVGATSANLPDQLARLRALGRHRPELTVIMIGANDVTARSAPAVAVPHLEDTVRALVDGGVEVVVGTCPDLGTIRPISQPLRAYARRLSRRMAREQTVAVVRAGGRTVSLGDLLGPLFMTRLELFSEDRFHPSAAGYAEAAAAMLPSALDALGLRTRARSASAFTTRRVKPVARAAAQAAAHPGTEVVGAERFGRAENRRGPLARLRRRLPRRRSLPPTSPDGAVPVR
ncbi:Lysophospholipase L1 [Jatrophihabitans endophyticus]|uniref:Lysophospholipase L1 n=1 Tax=Jatrophihabitans endophyticus TaxID=1206085 RepID=A0A1M5SRS6_9ACTN|nr:Lysophospholipase L1 [Jatrophihabitans endophyticus]